MHVLGLSDPTFVVVGIEPLDKTIDAVWSGPETDTTLVLRSTAKDAMHARSIGAYSLVLRSASVERSSRSHFAVVRSLPASSG
jgi:hypothetical protein